MDVSRQHWSRTASMLVLVLPLVFWSGGASAATSLLPLAPVTTAVSRSDYGLDVFSYDTQLNAPSTVPALNQLNMGMQQFPNENQWSWVTNTYRTGGTAPVSLADWGNLLQSTNNQGLFIFNYDENPTFTGGGTPADATQLTQYIVSHHLPITAIVIGSEEYGAWDYTANLNPSVSAQYYAQHAALIAQAIHAVDPSMKVGVSFDLGQGPNSLAWDQTVLRTDGSSINFVSIHDYPNQSLLSNSGLLSALPSEIGQAMQFVHGEIAANVPASYANGIQTWVTEYNPYGEPGPQSIAPVYGAAMVESAMLWKTLGASKLFLWSYDGQAHVATPGWPVATSATQPYGLFALAGDGQTPELPINTLYPSGMALAEYMNAIGAGSTLSVWMTSNAIVGQVGTGVSAQVFAINTSAQNQSLPLSTTTLTLPAASLQTATGQVTNASLAGSAPALTTADPNLTSYQANLPTFQAPESVYPGESVTLTGTGLGVPGTPSSVLISQNGINYGGPEDGDAVTVTQSTPEAVTFTVPDGSSGPSLTPGSATIQIETAADVVSDVQSMTVKAPPPLTVTANPTTVYPGQTLTLTGSNLGSTQGAGYVEISNHGLNYGAPPDAYTVPITSWSNSSITLTIPAGSSGPALAPGNATVTVVNNAGIVSTPVSLTVTVPPSLSVAVLPTIVETTSPPTTVYELNFPPWL